MKKLSTVKYIISQRVPVGNVVTRKWKWLCVRFTKWRDEFKLVASDVRNGTKCDKNHENLYLGNEAILNFENFY